MISSGNEVFIGEPIAKISAGNNSQLYFELRLNGKIINPKSKVEIFVKKLHNHKMKKTLLTFIFIFMGSHVSLMKIRKFINI